MTRVRYKKTTDHTWVSPPLLAGTDLIHSVIIIDDEGIVVKLFDSDGENPKSIALQTEKAMTKAEAVKKAREMLAGQGVVFQAEVRNRKPKGGTDVTDYSN